MPKEILVAIIAAGAAIIASVSANVVTAVVSAHREKKRLQFEMERYRAEAESAERARFDDVKREAFVAYLDGAARLLGALSIIKSASLITILFTRGYLRRQLFESASEHLRCVNQITLMAPEIRDEVRAVSDLVERAQESIVRGNFAAIDLDAIIERVSEVRKAMQRALRIEPGPDAAYLLRPVSQLNLFRKR
jgi:hypothetical protein